MNSKKIVSSFVLAAVCSAALVSNASAAEPRWSRGRKAAGGIGLAATGAGAAWWLWNRRSSHAGRDKNKKQEQDTPELMSFEGRISAHATENAPFIVHHSEQGDFEVCVIIGCSHDTYRESQANFHFNNLLLNLRNVGIDATAGNRVVSTVSDLEELLDEMDESQSSGPGLERHIRLVLGRFVEKYTKTVPIEIPIQVLIIDRATGRAHFGACHKWLALGGIPFEQEKFEVEIEEGAEPGYCQCASFDLSQVPAGKIVLCGPNIQNHLQHQHFTESQLLQWAVPGEINMSPAENLIEFVLRRNEGQDSSGFAVIVVDLSLVDEDNGDGVIEDDGASFNDGDSQQGKPSGNDSNVNMGWLEPTVVVGGAGGVGENTAEKMDSGAGVGEGDDVFENEGDPQQDGLNTGAARGGATEHNEEGDRGAAARGDDVFGNEDDPQQDGLNTGATRGGATKHHEEGERGDAARGDDVFGNENSGSYSGAYTSAGNGGGDDASRNEGYSDEHDENRGWLKRCCHRAMASLVW